MTMLRNKLRLKIARRVLKILYTLDHNRYRASWHGGMCSWFNGVAIKYDVMEYDLKSHAERLGLMQGIDLYAVYNLYSGFWFPLDDLKSRRAWVRKYIKILEAKCKS